MASMDSCLASPMKLQVLTTITSAAAGSSTTWWPASPTWPSMTSVSTRFLGQPSETKWTFFMARGALAYAATAAGSRKGEDGGLAVEGHQPLDVLLDHVAAGHHRPHLAGGEDLVGA